VSSNAADRALSTIAELVRRLVGWVTQGSQSPVREVGGAELVAAEQVDVLVPEWGQALDVVVADVEAAAPQLVPGLGRIGTGSGGKRGVLLDLVMPVEFLSDEHAAGRCRSYLGHRCSWPTQRGC
jgi:hypothetical protein